LPNPVRITRIDFEIEIETAKRGLPMTTAKDIKHILKGSGKGKEIVVRVKVGDGFFDFSLSGGFDKESEPGKFILHAYPRRSRGDDGEPMTDVEIAERLAA
jgi:hypothetical protein